MSLSQWGLLGFVLWTLGLLVCTIGYPRVSAVMRREARPNSFNASVPHGSELYQRCMRAHLNCIENLPMFGALVWLGSAAGVTSSLFQVAAFAVLPARLGQSLSHISSGRNRAVVIRFYFYCTQLICFALMAGLVIARALG